jgi:hypothetical protein
MPVGCPPTPGRCPATWRERHRITVRRARSSLSTGRDSDAPSGPSPRSGKGHLYDHYHPPPSLRRRASPRLTPTPRARTRGTRGHLQSLEQRGELATDRAGATTNVARDSPPLQHNKCLSR